MAILIAVISGLGVGTLMSTILYFGFDSFILKRDGVGCIIGMGIMSVILFGLIVYAFERDEWVRCTQCRVRGQYLVQGLCARCWYDKYGRGKTMLGMRDKLKTMSKDF
jgi:hypothetical protein